MAKYRSPRDPYHSNDFCMCNNLKALDTLFTENVNDVAEALVKIMVVFGLQPLKAQTAKSVIVKAFKFCANKRHRFDDVSKSGLSRSDVLCKFKRKCKMSYMEALLAYTVLKRAVKAFFPGLPNYSIRSTVAEAVALTKQEFIWQHAAIRTNQIFGSFEHVFSQAPHNYAKQIIKIYEELYGRMKRRVDSILKENSLTRVYTKKKIVGAEIAQKLNAVKTSSEDSTDFFLTTNHSGKWSERKTNETKNIELNLSRCYKCNCPQLICDCQIESETGILAIDCSQGPFKCQWVRVDYFDEPESHICPIDCVSSESCSESGG